MRHFKKLFLVVLVCALTWGSYSLYYDATDGFSVGRITSSLAFDARWETNGAIPTAILNQPFQYLGKGCQAYVFVSEDGKYVIKFFKHYHFEAPWYYSYLPNGEKKLAQRAAKRELLFSGTLLAYNKLPQETGLIYLHLNKTKNKLSTITLYNKWNIAYHLPLDDFEFVVQESTLPLKQLVPTLSKDEAKELFTKMKIFTENMDRKGVYDSDRNFVNNLGYRDGKILLLDTGQLSTAQTHDTKTRFVPFKKWLAKVRPELDFNQ